MGKPRIAIVDHSYHRQTRSTEFFFDLFRDEYEVEVFWDEGWENPLKKYWAGGLPIRGNFKYIFFLQVFPPPGLLSVLKCKQIFCVPMFDGMIGLTPEFFCDFRRCRFISFSRTLHQFLSAIGLRSSYIQYFPEVDSDTEIEEDGNGEISVFFWQRREPVTFRRVRDLLGNGNGVKSVHVHSKTDPGFEYLNHDLEGGDLPYKLTVSSWFETRDGFHDLLEKCDIFIAPREFEGIGMSFLEAMALGKCVVAADRPTHSEYIEHGVNGYLYDPESQSSLELHNIDQMKAAALRTVKEGRETFENSCRVLLGCLRKGDFTSFGEVILGRGGELHEGCVRMHNESHLILREMNAKSGLVGAARKGRRLIQTLAGCLLCVVLGWFWRRNSERKPQRKSEASL